ncbi:MAG: hypothetical protein ACKO2K_06765, partial [Alphaproteobacteria bacterium]
GHERGIGRAGRGEAGCAVSRRDSKPAWHALSERLGTDDPLVALERTLSDWAADPALAATTLHWVGARADGPRAGERLLELEAATADKATRREIRRALHRLEQRGVFRRPERPPPPSASELLGPGESDPEAWLSEIDPGGTRLLWIARRVGDGVASLSAVVNDVTGVQELNAGETRRKAIRDAHRSLTANTGLALVEAPWRHVDGLLEEALRIAPDEKRTDTVESARRELLPDGVRGEVGRPIDSVLDRAAIERDRDALLESPELRREKDGPAWLVPFAWLEAAVETVSSARESLVVVSPAQQEERVREAFERAIEQVLAEPGRRELFARRFAESAWVAARRGRLERARALDACALAIEAGLPVSAIPPLADLVRLSLAFALEARARRAEEQGRSSLVVTPAQAMAESRRPPRR